MATMLTMEAAEGYHSKTGDKCPYLNTSPASMAWYLGRFLAHGNFWTPAPEASIKADDRVAVFMGRGDRLVIRGRCDIHLAMFEWRNGNLFREVLR